MQKPLINMHIDAALKEQLRERAKRENRSLANLIETLLKQSLKNEK